MDGMQISTIMENLLFPEVEYFIIFQIFANIYTLWRIMIWFAGILEGKERYNIYPGESLLTISVIINVVFPGLLF